MTRMGKDLKPGPVGSREVRDGEKKKIQGRAGEIVGEQLAAWAEKSWLEKE